jgi:hypothetical protein
MDWCRKIRNQFAHCNWYWTLCEGLCFVDLEAQAKLPDKITSITVNRAMLGLDLLKEQEGFFGFVRYCFWRLASAYHNAVGRQPPSFDYAMPTRMVRPPLHR